MVEGGKDHWLSPSSHSFRPLQPAGGDGTDGGSRIQQHLRRVQSVSASVESCPSTASKSSWNEPKKDRILAAILSLRTNVLICVVNGVHTCRAPRVIEMSFVQFSPRENPPLSYRNKTSRFIILHSSQTNAPLLSNLFYQSFKELKTFLNIEYKMLQLCYT